MELRMTYCYKLRSGNVFEAISLIQDYILYIVYDVWLPWCRCCTNSSLQFFIEMLLAFRFLSKLLIF